MIPAQKDQLLLEVFWRLETVWPETSFRRRKNLQTRLSPYGGWSHDNLSELDPQQRASSGSAEFIRPTYPPPPPTSPRRSTRPKTEPRPSHGCLVCVPQRYTVQLKNRLLKWANNMNLLFRSATIQNRGISKEEHWIIISVKKILPKMREDSGLLAIIYNLI